MVEIELTGLELREAAWRAMGCLPGPGGTWRRPDNTPLTWHGGGFFGEVSSVNLLPAVESDPHALGFLVEWLDGLGVAWWCQKYVPTADYIGSTSYEAGVGYATDDGALWVNGKTPSETLCRFIVAYAEAQKEATNG